MKQCQVCHSILTDGRKIIEGKMIAMCRECASDSELTFASEGIYLVISKSRWGKSKRYALPLNK